MGRRAFLTICLLTSVLAACGPSQADQDAQATKIAAGIFATQTADMTLPAPTTPTLTPSPSPSPDFATDTYTDQYGGFSIRYPNRWEVRAEPGDHAWFYGPSPGAEYAASGPICFLNIDRRDWSSLSDYVEERLDSHEHSGWESTEPVPVVVGDTDGVVVDVTGALFDDGHAARGRFVYALNRNRAVVLGCMSIEETWDITQPVFEMMLDSASFFEAEATPEPTPEPPGAWSLIPISVTKTSTGGGWAQLHVEFAVRNDTGEWSRMWSSAVDIGVPRLTTAEGYTYQCGPFDLVSGHPLPPGFQVRGIAAAGVVGARVSYVDCEVAEQSTGYQLCIPYGYDINEISSRDFARTATACIDLEQPIQTLTYPAGSAPESAAWLYSVGDEFDLPNGTLVLDAAVHKTGKVELGMSIYDGLVTLQWTMENSLGGYDYEINKGISILGSDGLIYDYHYYTVQSPTAGPGQSITFQDHLPVPSDVSGLYLVVYLADESDWRTWGVVPFPSP